jgi:hypothetical protein
LRVISYQATNCIKCGASFSQDAPKTPDGP